MQQFFNKKFRHRGSESLFVDEFLEDLDDGTVDVMRSLGVDVYPRDENDVFVPIDKNTPYNLEMVQQTVHTAYGLKDKH